MKKQQTVDEYAELNSAIRLAAKDAGPKTTSREAAQALLESARELIDRFASLLESNSDRKVLTTLCIGLDTIDNGNGVRLG